MGYSIETWAQARANTLARWKPASLVVLAVVLALSGGASTAADQMVPMPAVPSRDGPVSSTALPFGSQAPRPKANEAKPIGAAEPVPAAAVPTRSVAVPVVAPVAPTIAKTEPVPAVAAPLPPVSAAEQVMPAEPPKPSVLLTLRGSNTVGLELAPRIAQAYLAYNGASEVSILRSKDDRDEATIVGSRGGKQEAIVVSAHGSGFAAKGLAAHSDAAPTDIGMTSRRMTQLERELLMPKGDMYNPTSEHVLALDGVAVIVNPANTIGVLSVQQIKDVFAGTIVDWGDKRLGGTPGPIALYARDANSGTFDTFSSLALRGAKLRSDAQRFEDSEALSAAVSKDPNGIGFIGLPYVATNKAIAVSDGGASPVRPNRLTVATEGYAFARRLFLYTAPGNANPDTHRFVEFALSQAGQKLVEQVGFVALTLQAESVKLAPGTPPEYEAMIRNAERLSTDFRFRFNSVDLDNRSVRDTTRLADYLASRRIDPRRLLLVGFGDNIGQPAAIKAVSENRARAVAAALRQDGIAVGQTAGFGALMLVADNSTDEGRDKNRRVEVFLRP